MELRSLRERLKMRVAAELDLTRDVEDAEIARMIARASSKRQRINMFL